MRIRWTELAAQDLTHICDYIEEHEGPGAARRVATAICQGVDALSRFPNRGRPGRKTGTRELVFPGFPFLAIYRVGAEIVEINRILHGAQKWP